MTVNELLYELNIVASKGYGDKTILIPQDEEGNGFYPLLNCITTGDDVKDFVDLFNYGCPDASECIILG